MSATESESADADADSEDEFEYYPQVTQHPHTFIAGNIVGIVTGADIDNHVEDTGTSFGVIFENPTVPNGSIWQNRNIPEGFETASEFNDTLQMAAADDDDSYIRGQEVTEESIEAAQERLVEQGVLDSADDTIEITYGEQGMEALVDGDDVAVNGTDFKVADTSDADVQEVEGNVLGIDVGGGVYSSEEADEFGADRIMVWYGGMAGQFVGRALDYNGRPSARYKDDGYLVKGLYQHPIGWFERDAENFDSVPTTDRAKLATDLGRPPRVARPPILRSDVDGEESFIEIDRYNGGQMHEVTLAFNDFEGDDSDEATEIEPRYEQEPEERLAAEFDNADEVYALYHGDGWQDKPDNAQSVTDTSGDGSDTGDASFDVDVDVSDDAVEHPTEEEVEFAETISEKIAGTGANPDDSIFGKGENKTDLEGLVGSNADQFSVTPDVDAIREVVYENTGHLDADDL
jgi:hypothetical protein